jgi:putative ABC transport system permease protein
MLSRDFLYATRSLGRSPVFALTAIGTIALGIGASTAIFSVANAVLLRSLPYQDADRIVLIASDLTRRSVRDFPWSNADFIDIRNNTKKSMEDVAAVSSGRFLAHGRDGTPEQIRLAVVSPNFFRLIGTTIRAGRDFSEEDGIAPADQPPPALLPQDGAPPPQPPLAAILSYEYFQRRFGGDPSIIGQTVPSLDGPKSVIVGVAAPGVELLFPPGSNIERTPEVWFAGRIKYDTATRNNVQWRVLGKLRPGVTVAQAQSEAEVLSEELQRQNPISKTAGQKVRIEPMKSHLVESVRPAILTLMGAVLFLLLIASANVANLMLVRSGMRERELAVRTAIGGSAWQLIRQLMAEALVIAAAGTVLGVALAWIGVGQLVRIAPPSLPRLEGIRLDPAVLLFSIAAGVAAALLFGLLPAWRSAKPDIASVLRSSGRTSNLSGSGFLRSAVVVLEVALSFVLLIGSGLMVQTFLAVQKVDLGFDPNHLLTFQLLGNTGNNPDARAAFQQRFAQSLRALPGVESATAAFPLPLAAPFSPIRWGTAEALTDETKFRATDFQIVLPGYFEAMKIPVIAGRTFTEADNNKDRRVLVVDELLAKKAFGNESAIGKQILFRARTPKPEWGEIIGVVRHQRNTSLVDPGREQIFLADGLFSHGAAGWWAVRTQGDPAQYAPQIRQAINDLGGAYLANELRPMDRLVENARASTRFALVLIGLFAATAALLAAVGLYGVLATLVRQRTAEIGVRMALGAEPATVFRLIVGQGVRLSAIGIVAGVAVAIGLTRWIETMLVGVKPTDPATYIAMAVVFFLVAIVSAWIPARRAAGLDPTVALRQD